MMTKEEQQLEEQDQSIPSLSGQAFASAYTRAIQSGHSVLVSDEGIIYRISPDGKRTLVKRIEAPTAVKKGSRITIKR